MIAEEGITEVGRRLATRGKEAEERLRGLSRPGPTDLHAAQRPTMPIGTQTIGKTTLVTIDMFTESESL